MVESQGKMIRNNILMSLRIIYYYCYEAWVNQLSREPDTTPVNQLNSILRS